MKNGSMEISPSGKTPGHHGLALPGDAAQADDVVSAAFDQPAVQVGIVEHATSNNNSSMGEARPTGKPSHDSETSTTTHVPTDSIVSAPVLAALDATVKVGKPGALSSSTQTSQATNSQSAFDQRTAQPVSRIGTNEHQQPKPVPARATTATPAATARTSTLTGSPTLGAQPAAGHAASTVLVSPTDNTGDSSPDVSTGGAAGGGKAAPHVVNQTTSDLGQIETHGHQRRQHFPYEVNCFSISSVLPRTEPSSSTHLYFAISPPVRTTTSFR